MTTRFKAPYGTPDQHVIAPAHHHGYHHLVARLVHEGKQAAFIRAECDAAHEQGQPHDVVHRDASGTWTRRADADLPQNTRHRIDTYAIALVRYATALRQERASR